MFSLWLDGALTLAADHLEQFFLAPVHVHVDILMNRPHFLELVQHRIDRLRSDPVDERYEVLIIVSMLFVDADDLPNRLRDALRRDT